MTNWDWSCFHSEISLKRISPNQPGKKRISLWRKPTFRNGKGTNNCESNGQDHHIDYGKYSFTGCGEIAPPIEMQPKDGGKDVCGDKSVCIQRGPKRANSQLKTLPKIELCCGLDINQPPRTTTRTYNETQQVIETGNWLRNDPSNNPKYQSNPNPRSDRYHTAFMQVRRSAKQPNVYVFTCNMTGDHTSDQNLMQVSLK